MRSKCKLCRTPSELCNSHAIPDSLFKSIFSAGSGQAILLDGADGVPIKKTQDSWATKQLCKRCESKLNTYYEDYSQKVLRNKFGSERTESGVSFQNIDTQIIRSFVAAILWRVSISDHKNYAAITLSDKLNEKLRFTLNTSSEISKRTFSVRGFKLIDSTEGSFSRKNLRDCIISPFMRTYMDANHKSVQVVCFLFLGFFFEVFISGVPSGSEYHHEFIGYSKTSYVFPFLEITEIPELFELMVIAYGKNAEGLSAI
ncbi:hypothetical protein [Vibrio diabolicus]